MKKKFFCAVMLLVSAFLAYGQSDFGPGKGKMFVAGGLGISSVTESHDDYDEDVKTTAISVMPTLGYFVSDNLAIGGAILVEKRFQKNTKGGTGTGLSVFARMYKTSKIGELKVAAFLEGRAFYVTETPLYPEQLEKPENNSRVALNASPGVGIYPSKWGIEFHLSDLLSISRSSTANGNSTGIHVGVFSTIPSLSLIYFLK